MVRLRIPGLDATRKYTIENGGTFHGSTLMNAGINISSDLRGNAVSALYHLKAK